MKKIETRNAAISGSNKELVNISLRHLKDLQYPTGLFGAASKRVKTGYDKAWIRDNIYAILGFEAAGDYATVKRVLQSLFDVFLKHEYKIDHAIAEKPKEKWQYIHPRYHPITFDEFFEEWGNKQNDAVGAFLWKVGELEMKGIKVMRDSNDARIIQKLVDYLDSIEYWHDKDNGMWEENEEVHASSVGACLAGLEAVKKMVNVPKHMLEKGQRALEILLPRESPSKTVDLALLSLIYPYNLVNDFLRDLILHRVETALLRENGVIRYPGDKYYSHEGKEAEWTMGLVWLSVIYKQAGDAKKSEEYLLKARKVMNSAGELPELYSGSVANENTPLAWAQSLHIVASL